MVAIPFSREFLERRSKIDEKPLFRATGISKCQIPAFVRLTGKCFLAHLASSNSERINARSESWRRSLSRRTYLYACHELRSPKSMVCHGPRTMRQSFPKL
jgi:hypothetical protein